MHIMVSKEHKIQSKKTASSFINVHTYHSEEHIVKITSSSFKIKGHASIMKSTITWTMMQVMVPGAQSNDWDHLEEDI